MQKLILDTAHKIFIKQGYENTSIRNIAKKIEYSPATLYLYFEDKDEILFNLKEKYFLEFFEKLNEFHFIKDHFSRLKNISVSYLEYALSNPKHYELMYCSNVKNIKTGRQKELSGEQQIIKVLKDTVEACLNHNLIKRMPVDQATNMIWAFLHGLSSLLLKNKITGVPKNQMKDQTDEMFNRFLNNLKVL